MLNIVLSLHLKKMEVEETPHQAYNMKPLESFYLKYRSENCSQNIIMIIKSEGNMNNPLSEVNKCSLNVIMIIKAEGNMNEPL